MRILTVEDDTLLAQTIADVLTQYHHAVDIASDGEAGWQFAIAADYDLILLDVMLPKLDGISLCRQLRQASYQMPILLLTARDTQTDKIMGLDAGADDYVVKPFEFDELTARIRALLRRGHSSSPVLEWGSLRLDPTACEATYEGQVLPLTSTEHSLLELFLRNGQRVFSRHAIVEHLWAFEDPPEAATIKSHIKNLRQKLKATGAPSDLIETVYGVGYRLKPLPGQPTSTGDQSSEFPDVAIATQQVLQAVMKTRESFTAQIGDRLSILAQAVEAIATGIHNPELHQQAIQAAHKLVGALGTFGFSQGSQIAEAIEDLLQISSLNPRQINHLQRLIHSLGGVLKLDEKVDFSPGHPKNQPLDQALRQELKPLCHSPALADSANCHSLWLLISQDTQWFQGFAQVAAAQQIQTQMISDFSLDDAFVERSITILAEQEPEVVLLDFDTVSTKQNCLALLTGLSERLPSTPLFVLVEEETFEECIQVARRGGKGYLPKTASTTRIVDFVEQRSRQYPTDGGRVLIVDDEVDVFKTLQNILEPEGLRLKFINSSQLFWKGLVNFSPDLLILGTGTQDVSGMNLCQVVRNDLYWNQLPILFLTSHSDADTVDPLIAAGANGYVEKPITASILLTQIQYCKPRLISRDRRSGLAPQGHS